jgi:hypothetical protein
MAQDVAATFSALYTQALAANEKASAEVNASTLSFNGNDAATGCSGMRDARKVYGEARGAMEGMRDILGTANELTADYKKQGLDWVNQNEPVVDDSMRQIDRVLDERCETSSSASTGGIDQLLDHVGVLMNQGIAANRQSREAFQHDDLGPACTFLEFARQSFSDGYAGLMDARSRVQSDHALPASVQRQYFDTIDNVKREADGLGAQMADLWRNRCSSR